VTGAADWLAARSPAPPERLAARMGRAVASAGARDELFDTLGAAALRCLDEALRAETRAEAALDLLAADGLLTYAWEAAAEAGPGTIRRFVAAYSPDKFAALLAEAR
jgi:hypothetical protein